MFPGVRPHVVGIVVDGVDADELAASPGRLLATRDHLLAYAAGRRALRDWEAGDDSQMEKTLARCIGVMRLRTWRWPRAREPHCPISDRPGLSSGSGSPLLERAASIGGRERGLEPCPVLYQPRLLESHRSLPTISFALAILWKVMLFSNRPPFGPAATRAFATASPRRP
jgi:hypothetical protein